jgi:hypothetical protein
VYLLRVLDLPSSTAYVTGRASLSRSRSSVLLGLTALPDAISPSDPDAPAATIADPIARAVAAVAGLATWAVATVAGLATWAVSAVAGRATWAVAAVAGLATWAVAAVVDPVRAPRASALFARTPSSFRSTASSSPVSEFERVS